jgi:hypothetical protein
MNPFLKIPFIQVPMILNDYFCDYLGFKAVLENYIKLQKVPESSKIILII